MDALTMHQFNPVSPKAKAAGYFDANSIPEINENNKVEISISEKDLQAIEKILKDVL